jgi:RNA polymerase sigma factor (sigma-70 family)
MPLYATQQRNEPGVEPFQAFYEDNLVSVYRFVFKSLRNREEAEDLTSQIFLKALRFLDPERSAQRARSWLFQIARTTIADYWRTYYRTPTSSLDVRLEVGWEGPTEEGIVGQTIERQSGYAIFSRRYLNGIERCYAAVSCSTSLFATLPQRWGSQKPT